MAVVDITSFATTRQDDRRMRFVRSAVRRIDRETDILRLAVDSAALADAEGELIEALYAIHREMRAQTDQLMQLL